MEVFRHIVFRNASYEGIRDAFGEDCVTYTDGKSVFVFVVERFVCLTARGRLALGSRSEVEEFGYN